jgi:hypothetical protein
MTRSIYKLIILTIISLQTKSNPKLKNLIEYQGKINEEKILGSKAKLITKDENTSPGSSINIFSLNSKWYILSIEQDFYAPEKIEIIDVSENFDLTQEEMVFDLAKSYYIGTP